MSVDEMMTRFKGKSTHTFRMKNKPIKEGYKSWALCDAQNGFMYWFEPVPRVGEHEKREVKALMERVAAVLPHKDTLTYCVTADNFFTTSAAVRTLYEHGIGCCGTIRGRRGWPPKELTKISDETFNHVHTCVDDNGILLYRWVDNQTVMMCSTVHDATDVVLKSRRRPRENPINAARIRRGWGDNHRRDIEIPQVVDFYNHKMLGVDLCDQLISYFTPKLRCRRTWMPLMIQCLNIVRVNAYLIHKALAASVCSHKDFLEQMILSLLTRAQTEASRPLRHSLAPTQSHLPEKRRRVSTRNPQLPDERLAGERSSHRRVVSQLRRSCAYCCYLRAEHKVQKLPGNPPSIAITTRMCLKCDVYLCHGHHDKYHTQ